MGSSPGLRAPPRPGPPPRPWGLAGGPRERPQGGSALMQLNTGLPLVHAKQPEGLRELGALTRGWVAEPTPIHRPQGVCPKDLPHSKLGGLWGNHWPHENDLQRLPSFTNFHRVTLSVCLILTHPHKVNFQDTKKEKSENKLNHFQRAGNNQALINWSGDSYITENT